VAVAQAPARPRSGGGRLFIIIGVVLAIVGFLAAVALGNLGGGKSGGTAACPCSLVVYAAKDISLRTQITSQDQIAVRSIPDTYKPAGAITIDGATKEGDKSKKGLEAVQNYIAEVNIVKDQPLLTSTLAKPGDNVTGAQAAYLPIPDGYVAFTLPTSEQVGVAGYIQPGDYITVLASAGSQKTAATVTVFTQLHVLRVGPANLSVTSASSSSAASNQPTTTAPATSLTVVVTACDSELITWLANNSQLKYELESYKNYAPNPTAQNPTCPTVLSAKGIQATDIVTRYPAFKQAFGGVTG